MTRVLAIYDEDLPSIECLSVSDIINKPYQTENSGAGSSQSIIGNNEPKTQNFTRHSMDVENNLEEHFNRSNVNVENGEPNTLNIIEHSTFGHETRNEDSNEEGCSMEISLDEEKSFHENKARVREQIFKDIIQNEQTEVSLKYFFGYPVGISVLGFTSTIILSLIPANDIVQYPEYWYEILLHGFTGPMIWGIAFTCVQAGTLLNIKFIYSPKNFCIIYLAANAVSCAILVCSYHLWTKFFNYQYPIPFLGFLLAFFFPFFCSLVIWFRFPHEWRKSRQLKKRMKIFCIYLFFRLALTICYQIIIDEIRRSNADHQPFVALALPAIREISIWIGSKLIEKCSNGDEKGAKIFLKYSMTTTHTITLGYVIGSYTTGSTSWVLMGADFSCNVFICLSVIWTKKFHPAKIQKQNDLLQDLAIYELVEFHALLSFIMVISVAYYGPNASILGNIGNSYWTYTAIENIHQTLANMAIFFMIDFSSTLLSGIILWVTCRINLWSVFLELQKEFGKWFCLTLGNSLILVINCVTNNSICNCLNWL